MQIADHSPRKLIFFHVTVHYLPVTNKLVPKVTVVIITVGDALSKQRGTHSWKIGTPFTVFKPQVLWEALRALPKGRRLGRGQD